MKWYRQDHQVDDIYLGGGTIALLMRLLRYFQHLSTFCSVFCKCSNILINGVACCCFVPVSKIGGRSPELVGATNYFTGCTWYSSFANTK